MRSKVCLWFLFCICFCLGLSGGYAKAQEQVVVVGGTFYDCRYGDILLGANNLTLAPHAKITVQNISLSESKLDKKYAKMLGCAHLNELGLVTELHLDPVSIVHEPTCDFAFLEYGPQIECQGGVEYREGRRFQRACETGVGRVESEEREDGRGYSSYAYSVRPSGRQECGF